VEINLAPDILRIEGRKSKDFHVFDALKLWDCFVPLTLPGIGLFNWIHDHTGVIHAVRHGGELRETKQSYPENFYPWSDNLRPAEDPTH